MRQLTSILLIMSVLLIVTVASEIFITDMIHPTSLFAYFLLSAFIGGLSATFIMEMIEMKK